MCVPKLSISVPVYNTEKYLRKCLDSLLRQTLKDIEIVLVDDGSTDGSGEICDEYSLIDSRIKVIHKKNGGLSSARQVGLDNSVGEYYTVCDSDDWVEDEMYEVLYNKAKSEDYDMVVCDILTEYNDGSSRVLKNNFSNYEQTSLINDLMFRNILSNTFCRIYKRCLFQKYDIEYEPGINQGEDFLLLMKQFQHPMKITYVPSPLYHYRRDMRSNSYTNNIKLESVQQMEFIREWQYEHLDNEIYRKGLFHGCLNLAFSCIRSEDPRIDKQYYSKFSDKYFQPSKLICNPEISLKYCIVMLSIISYPFAKKMCKIFYQYFYV